MRSRRLVILLIAFYFAFLGGSAYYTLVFPMRLFHHVFVTAVFGWWFLRKLRGDGLPRTSLNAPLLAALVVWVATSALSIDTRMAFENLWFVLLHVGIFYVIVDLLQHGRQRLVFETQFLLAALVVFISGLELASWYFGLGITPGTEVGWISVFGPGAWLPLELPRVSLAMNISTLLAGYVAPLVTLTIGWALTVRRQDYRRVLWWLVLGLVVVLVFTQSRGGLLSMFTGVGTLVLFRLSQREDLARFLNPRILLSAGLIVASIGVVVISVSQTRSSGDRIRLDMYRSAVEILVDYPLTGVGTGIYGRAFREYRTGGILARDRLASAHNAYLNTAAETGLPGLIVSAWVGGALLWAWWCLWRAQTNDSQRLRMEAALAALLGVGIHSLFDVFTTTPVNMVIVLLVAYCVIGHRTAFDERPTGVKWTAGLGLVITLGYGVFFFQVDRANILYRQSLVGGENALEAVQLAEQLDPALTLYDLHIAHLLGEQAVENPSTENLAIAVEAYERALQLEPTWDVGWANLGALELEQGNINVALSYLERATEIYGLTHLGTYIGQFSEQTETEALKDVVRRYRSGLHWNILNNNRLPVTNYWDETALRHYAFKEYLYTTPLVTVEWLYRTVRVQNPAWAALLVDDAPQSAPEFWVAGEHALTVEGDAEAAVNFFTDAIRRDRRNGDYYVSRARAAYLTDPEMALRDLNMATLLGVQFEYPNRLRAEMAETSEDANFWLARALPPREVPQEFAAVLYGGRVALFDLLPALRPLGPGREVMQPWYTLAENYRVNGRVDSARRVYEAILDYAPDEQEAHELLAQLPTSAGR